MATCAHCGSNRQSTGACPNCGSFASQSVNVTIVHQHPPRSWWERNDWWAGPALALGSIVLIFGGLFGWAWFSSQFNQVVVIEKAAAQCMAVEIPCKVFVFDEEWGSERVWLVTDSKTFETVKPGQRHYVNHRALRIISWEEKKLLELIRSSAKLIEQLWPEERTLEGVSSTEEILEEIAR